MHSAIDGFLRSLAIERNCSALTVKSYSEDLDSLLEYFTDFAGGTPPVDAIDVATLRAFVAYLHECNYARSTMARRLACLRSFFRYCCRQGLSATNPAKALRTPRAGRRLPHFLSAE
ncbi:MAG: tyrosine recombinase XerC, partial [Planctomycetaceae bacterium]